LIAGNTCNRRFTKSHHDDDPALYGAARYPKLFTEDDNNGIMALYKFRIIPMKNDASEGAYGLS